MVGGLTYLTFAGVIQLVECQLPKLDVTGSSPVARSLEVLELGAVPIAGIRTGPGDFFLGPIPGPLRPLIFVADSARCSGVSAASSASRATTGPALRPELWPGRAIAGRDARRWRTSSSLRPQVAILGCLTLIQR